MGGIGLGVVNLMQIAYALYMVQRAREAFTRRIRPPLVIKGSCGTQVLCGMQYVTRTCTEAHVCATLVDVLP